MKASNRSEWVEKIHYYFLGMVPRDDFNGYRVSKESWISRAKIVIGVLVYLGLVEPGAEESIGPALEVFWDATEKWVGAMIVLGSLREDLARLRG